MAMLCRRSSWARSVRVYPQLVRNLPAREAAFGDPLLRGRRCPVDQFTGAREIIRRPSIAFPPRQAPCSNHCASSACSGTSRLRCSAAGRAHARVTAHHAARRGSRRDIAATAAGPTWIARYRPCMRQSVGSRRPSAGCFRLIGRQDVGAIESLARTRMCRSRNCCSVTALGASISRSCPRCVFGNAITSRIWSTPAIIATSRSRPNAMPPCGGAPQASASSRKPNFLRCSSGADPERREHLRLHLRLVDAHRAAADLPAVQHDVVGLRERAAAGRSRSDPRGRPWAR